LKISFVIDRFTDSSIPIHQTFNGAGIVKGARYDNNASPDLSDFIVTFGTLPHEIPDWWDDFPRARKIAILPENPLIFFPGSEYLESHGLIIAPAYRGRPTSTRWIPTHAAVCWFYGQNFSIDRGLTHHIASDSSPPDLSTLAAMERSRKDKLLSIILSTKSRLPGHSMRIALASALKSRLGDKVDIFGFGHNPIANKSVALDRYQFTLVVENYFIPNYWTEKLSDAFLGFSMPIYVGAPNINDFFDFPIIQVSHDNPEKAMTEVLRIIDHEPDLAQLIANRNNILFRHNLFYHIENIIKTL
jgi:hypothetical protein